MTRTSIVFSSRRESSGCVPAAAQAASRSMSSGKRCQKGRPSMTARWALRNLAVETVFIACVICWLLRTLWIRRRRSIRVGMLRQALPEGVGEGPHRRGDLAVEGRVDVLLLPDLVEDPGVLLLEPLVELPLVGPDLRDRDAVEVAAVAGVDDQDLLLDRQGRVLALLEDLRQSLAAVELGLAR